MDVVDDTQKKIPLIQLADKVPGDNVEVLKLLIDLGADTNQLDDHGNSLIHLASMRD